MSSAAGSRESSVTRPRPNFYAHLHPSTLPAREARFTYTFGLGGISLLLFLVLGTTGVIEMFVYVPTPEGAHESVRQITYLAPFGWLLRNLHFWAAQLMVGTVILHMARVVFSGGYKARRFNWLIGIALLLLTILLDFTGYVLRWDQDTVWAFVVGTNLVKAVPGIGPALYRFLVGGEAVAAPALLRFYTWHMLGLAGLVLALATWHIFRVRRDGGISHRKTSARVRRDQLIRTEVTALLLTLAGLFGLSLLADAPLGPPGNPAGLATAPRAPWFFLWVQELLRIGPPFVAGVLVPLLVLLVAAALPYTLDRSDEGVAEWFNRPGRPAQIVFLAILVGLLILTLRGSVR